MTTPELERALGAQRAAFRPDSAPPFEALVRRKRARDRSRTAVAGSGLAAVGAAVVVAALPQLDGGPPQTLQGEVSQAYDGALVEAGALERDHVLGPVDYPGYPARPPMGGPHADIPQLCAVYAEPIAPEHAVHSMEHGAVWVTHRPDLAEAQVAALVEHVEGDRLRLMSPLPGQESPVVLTAWGRQLSVDRADDPRVEVFLADFTNGPQTPERGAACVGSTATVTIPG